MLKFVQRTIHYRREHAAWQEKYDAFAPRAGDPAPDFELGDAAGEQRIRLSDFQDQKPVALVFGSFT